MVRTNFEVENEDWVNKEKEGRGKTALGRGISDQMQLPYVSSGETSGRLLPIGQRITVVRESLTELLFVGAS